MSRTIEKSIAKRQDLAVIFIDRDYFKRVNDSHGHLAGSQVLREVGHLLKAHVRDQGGIPARYGGDEFVLVIPRVHLEEALDLAEEIRNDIVENTFCDSAGEIQREPLNLTGITSSIGVATLERHAEPGASIEECKSTLLRLADMAMYVAKKTGATALRWPPSRCAVGPQRRIGPTLRVVESTRSSYEVLQGTEKRVARSEFLSELRLPRWCLL